MVMGENSKFNEDVHANSLHDQVIIQLSTVVVSLCVKIWLTNFAFFFLIKK